MKVGQSWKQNMQRLQYTKNMFTVFHFHMIKQCRYIFMVKDPSHHVNILIILNINDCLYKELHQP